MTWKPNTNPFTASLCSIDHRPHTFRARRFYFRVQRYVAGIRLQKTAYSHADIDTDIFSGSDIERIMRVLAKIRIMDAEARHRSGSNP